MDNETMILYKLKNGIGFFYVISTDPTAAVKKLEDALNSACYGFSGARIVHTISVVAKDVKGGADGKPNFCGDNNLIL